MRILNLVWRHKNCIWGGLGRSSKSIATQAVKATENIGKTRMRTWQIDSYGGIESLTCNDNAELPIIRSGTDVLVEVHAASVNPLDAEMTSGYGRTVIGAMRQVANFTGSNIAEFPLVLGRDFSGVVSDKGSGEHGFKVGDEVMGVVLAPRQGTHAQFTVTPSTSLVRKPQNLTHEEAASLGYAGLTAWSALTCFGGLGPTKSKGKRVLIIGGSGGVGTIAIQMLKSWGATVGSVSSTDALNLVASLGADIIIDYKVPGWQKQLKEFERFDLVLNCVSHSAAEIETDTLKLWSNAKYVTVSTPLLRNIDAFGWPLGFLHSSAEFAFDGVKKLLNGQWHRWAYVLPSSDGFKEIAKLAEEGKLIPVIERVYTFEEIKCAYEKVKSGHARGKVVVTVKNSMPE